MSTGFRVFPNEDSDLDTTIKDYYSAWRATNQKSSEPFFPIFKSFKESYLAKLDGGALRLYIYLGFSSNNTKGDSWHSIQKIADFFGVQTRTVDGWIKTLVDHGLIYRTKSGHITNTTYLLPYSTTFRYVKPSVIFKDDSQGLIDHLVSKVVASKKIFGDIMGIYHLFQWGANKGKPIHTKNTQWILIITDSAHHVVTGHCYPLQKSEVYGVSKLYISDCFKFDSPYMYNGNPIVGLALSHTPRLKSESSIPDMKKLINDLSTATNSDFVNYPDIMYGEISDVLITADVPEDKFSGVKDSTGEGG